MQRSSRSFTLLEICICIALLAMGAAFFSFEIKKMVNEQRRKHFFSLLQSEMDQAKALALAYQADIDLSVIKEKGQYHLQMSSDTPIKFLDDKRGKKKLSFVKELTSQNIKIDNLVIHIYSSGMVSPSIENLKLKVD